MSKHDERTKKPGIVKRTLKLFFAVLVLLLVAPLLHQLDVSAETVRIAGRICVGVAFLLILFGIIAKMFRVLAFILICLLVLVILASEGVIQMPKVMNAVEQEKSL